MIFRQLMTAFFMMFAITQSTWAQQEKASVDQLVFVRCGALLDGKSDNARKNVVIAIRGEKITEVGAKEPAGAEIVDLSRETCLPGLIDTHTHVLLQGDITAADYDEQLLKQWPAQGRKSLSPAESPINAKPSPTP